MPDVYVGLGSNHEPGEHLRRAVARLAERVGTVACSGVYRGAAVGAPAPDYYNLAVRFATSLGGTALRSVLDELEDAAGRERGQRTLVSLDLDLLLYGVRVDPVLGVPRGDVLRRAFVLAPLAELAPTARHPITGEALGAVWSALAVRRPALVRVGTIDAPSRWD